MFDFLYLSTQFVDVFRFRTRPVILVTDFLDVFSFSFWKMVVDLAVGFQRSTAPRAWFHRHKLMRLLQMTVINIEIINIGSKSFARSKCVHVINNVFVVWSEFRTTGSHQIFFKEYLIYFLFGKKKNYINATHTLDF